MIFILILSAAPSIANIGLPVPTEVRCYSVSSHRDMGAGSFLDPQESIAVIQLAEAYERGCEQKVVALAEHRDELQTTAEAQSAALGAAAGASPFLVLLARRKLKKGPVAKPPPAMSF